MIVNQIGGDIIPAELVCEYPETRLWVLQCWKKSIYSSSIFFFLLLLNSRINDTVRQMQYCERPYLQMLAASLGVIWVTFKHQQSDTSLRFLLVNNYIIIIIIKNASDTEHYTN